MNRFKCLPNEFKNTKKQYHTSRLVDDWNKFGPEDFVFRIIHMGPEWANRKIRRERERQLVHENVLKTYNNMDFYPFTPYKNVKNVVLPPLKRVDEILLFPNMNAEAFYIKDRKNASPLAKNYEQPGIYVIVCFHATGGLFYFGETTNLLDRFSYIRSKLINSEKSSSTSWNKPLIVCKKRYGLESFLFIPLYVGVEWQNRQKRLKMETNLIRLNSSKALNVWKLNRLNFPQSGLPGLGDQEVKETSPPSQNPDPGFALGVEKNFSNEGQKQPMASPEKPILTPSLSYSRISSPILVKGNYYESINKAAIGEGTYPKFIRKRLKENHPDYKLLNGQDI